jgi:hypothetical protein
MVSTRLSKILFSFFDAPEHALENPCETAISAVKKLACGKLTSEL